MSHYVLGYQLNGAIVLLGDILGKSQMKFLKTWKIAKNSKRIALSARSANIPIVFLPTLVWWKEEGNLLGQEGRGPGKIVGAVR